MVILSHLRAVVGSDNPPPGRPAKVGAQTQYNSNSFINMFLKRCAMSCTHVAVQHPPIHSSYEHYLAKAKVVNPSLYLGTRY